MTALTFRHAELVSASVGKAYGEKLRSFCFKNNDFFPSSSDRSRNEFGMTFLGLFCLLIALTLPHQGLLHPAHIVMLNLFQHLSERLTMKGLRLSCSENNNSFPNSSDRSRNKFGMTTLDLFCLLIALTLPHQGLLHLAHIVC